MFDHAWVVVELEGGAAVALDATGGFAVDEKIPHFAYYYQGLAFDNPRQAKETDALIHSANDNCKAAAQLVDAWRQLRVTANALLGVATVQYNLQAQTAPGGVRPLALA